NILGDFALCASYRLRKSRVDLLTMHRTVDLQKPHSQEWLRYFYLISIFNMRPSEKTTLPVLFPEKPTGAPFFAGARVIAIWSPGLTEVLVQLFRRKIPGLWLSMAQFTTAPLSSFTSIKIWQWGLAHTNSVTVPEMVIQSSSS